MSIAEIYGKISQSGTNISDRMEDLLTSDVFGAFKYLNPSILLIPFLNKSINTDNPPEELKITDEIKSVKYDFWPKLTRSEPDVVITLETFNKDIITILIEAKYMSGKSSSSLTEEELTIAETPSDQLAREYSDLFDIDKTSKKYLIYVTSHRIIPKKTIKESINEINNFIESDKESEPIKNIFWNSWFNIIPLIKLLKDLELSVFENEIINDLELLLEKKGFIHFHGFKKLIELNKFYEIFYQSNKPVHNSDKYYNNLNNIELLNNNIYSINLNLKVNKYNFNLKSINKINKIYN